MKDQNCAYCVEGELVEKFGIKICELKASKVYLFREQSHRGRVIVASKYHVSEIVDLPMRDRQEFLEDVASVAKALHKVFNPRKVNYGAYGDTGCHLHFHLVPKYADDEFEWGGTFAMNPQRTFLTPAEYDELVAKIGAELLVGEGRDLRRGLVEMRNDIARDGKVDYSETTVLLRALEPYAETGAVMKAFVQALHEVREDGVITPEESSRVLGFLDELLS